MPKWRYTLKIKELWQDREDDENEQAIEIAPEVSRRIHALAKQVSDEGLRSDLEELADQFEDVKDEAGKASKAFNYYLNDLYDLGDRERIWVG